MDSLYKLIFEMQMLAGSATQDGYQVWDAGNQKQVNLLFRVLVAGTAGTLTIQHAAQNRPKSFVDLATVNLTTAVDTFVVKDGFLRFLRWKYDNAAGSPMAMIEGVAKK